MPFMRCTKDGKSGWKWGEHGHCYTGKDAKKKADEQRKAIEYNKHASALRSLWRKEWIKRHDKQING